MTAVVVATVIVFALLIGGADFAFTAMTSPLITPTNASTNPTAPASGSATPAASRLARRQRVAQRQRLAIGDCQPNRHPHELRYTPSPVIRP